jgi:hypothetical protein
MLHVPLSTPHVPPEKKSSIVSKAINSLLYCVLICLLLWLNQIVSRQGALPGLIPDSIAYLSSGEILNEGNITHVHSEVVSEVEDSDLSLSDTPQNPSGIRKSR